MELNVETYGENPFFRCFLRLLLSSQASSSFPLQDKVSEFAVITSEQLLKTQRAAGDECLISRMTH